MMWNNETNFYHDLNENKEQLPQKTIAGFWPLLAEMPNEDRASQLIAHLNNPNTFGTEHPFPSLSVDSPDFKVNGDVQIFLQENWRSQGNISCKDGHNGRTEMVWS